MLPILPLRTRCSTLDPPLEARGKFFLRCEHNALLQLGDPRVDKVVQVPPLRRLGQHSRRHERAGQVRGQRRNVRIAQSKIQTNEEALPSRQRT